MLQGLVSNLRDAVWLFLASGVLVLILEPGIYREPEWWKEKKASIILALINISIALLAFVSTWFVNEE